MKKLIPLVTLVFAAFLSSCGGSTESADQTKEEVDYSEFQGKSLKEYEIPALIMLPDQTSNIGASIEPEILHTEGDIKWTVNVGPNFSLLIEDYGREKDLINREKARLADIDFYTIEYVVDTADMLFYKRTLKYKSGSNANVGTDHTSYHCYGVKTINDIAYVFRSPDEGYHKPIIETMVKTIRSVEKL